MSAVTTERTRHTEQDLNPPPSSYYTPLGDGAYEPTKHVQGAWDPREQHMGPVSGLIAHAIDEHEPRAGMQLSRITYEILGMIPAERSAVSVRTIRPGRTIELVEAALVAGGRTVVRASAWRLAAQQTAAVAGGMPDRLPAPETMPPWDGLRTWAGGFISSVEGRAASTNEPGRGQVWLRTDTTLVAGAEPSPTAAFLGLVDTANGVVVRAAPGEWMFPNVDLTVHLFRQPVGGWVGLDTRVVFGADGVGLTSSSLHDIEGPVGRSEQILTVRRLPPTAEARTRDKPWSAVPAQP